MEKEHINLVSDPGKCSGCGACMAVCPQKAITMREAADSCVYPVIDHDTCIRCGKCLQICDFHRTETLRTPLDAWAAVGRDDALVKHSASGGIFATIAMRWIVAGGLVAGAVMDVDEQGLQVYHLLSDKVEDVRRMQGSKYVQSDAWRCYADVIAALGAGKSVLFSGTPCQVAAIRRITGDPDNLTTIDIICHGVPSQTMLGGYLRCLEKRFRGQIADINFRDKDGSSRYCARIDLQRNKRLRTLRLRASDLSYYCYFLTGMIFRENCYHCPYAHSERVGDITIGDYWGVEKRHVQDITAGEMAARLDWSCVLVASSKGRRLLKMYGTDLMLHASRTEWVAMDNQQLNHPVQKPSGRHQLFDAWRRSGYEAVEKNFIQELGGGIRYRVRLIKSLHRHSKALKNKGHKS